MKKIYLTIIWVYLILLTLPSVALAIAGVDNVNSVINKNLKKANQIAASSSTNKFNDLKKVSLKNAAKWHDVVGRLKAANIKKNKIYHEGIKKAPEAIIFASFSLPGLLLQQIIAEAGQYRIPVVMRGLYKNSFKETAQKMYQLVKQNNRGGILIDPVWFRQYGVKAVPALVVQAGGDKYDVLYGNIPVRKALEIIKEQGETGRTREIAQHLLESNHAD